MRVSGWVGEGFSMRVALGVSVDVDLDVGRGVLRDCVCESA